MKKFLGFVILSGFILMLGAAGSADVFGMGFVKLLLLEISGMIIILFGTSALMHYKRYLRRAVLKKRSANSLCKKTPVGVKIRLIHKELC